MKEEKELIFCDKTRNLELYSDGTTNISREKYLALEQENKILKSNTNVLNDYITKNEQLKTNIDSLVKINESLKQEIKELKENLLDKYSPRYYEVVPIRRQNEMFKKFENLRNQNNNYRSALEEINKIAEPRFVNGLNEEAELCNLAMDRIQNKIDEVLQKGK